MEKDNYEKTKKSWNLRIFRFVFFIVFIFIVSGASVVLWDKYIFPRLRANEWFGKLEFVEKGMEGRVVINKTEQVTVNEDQTITQFQSKSTASVVEVVSRKKSDGRILAAEKSKEKIGSGLVVAADGLVATYSEAVFQKDAEYKIFTTEGKSFDARLLLADSFSGLAFLKIDDVSNLSVAEFIAPQDVRVGSKVVAVGKSGFDGEFSYRLGILNEFDKSFSMGGPLASSERMQGALMMDANFDQTGSESLIGCPVVDYNGNVVGLLGMRKEDQAEKFFVVPVDIVRSVVDQFIEKGEIQRGSLGIYYILLSRENAFVSGNSYDKGALVYSPSGQQGLAVLSGSAAEKAGIRIMDIILSVNGEEINPNQSLAFLISKYHPGDEVNLKIVRDEKEMEMKVALQ